ncbi:putative quinol monooxygenase [Allorhodopirellula heiligendammensis]|uniref:Autoinducer 2-degrading protein LsrG n=1 Tax=Allorhodopirellula heiligendammensis TaxID=2714739 RepID=A0A5C6BW13_9BACT|nr:putative quinol monooxygenase [Allorhodopirellula heiligendammensis]TWU15416.1 Autoinducer 2-degrading protein LsrG [Allorhodopirellula heiligendammensis]|tara:strand:- start:755 stop:1057 length:303 start_codon:yes stop_codon:yes gene_type:complete
MSQPTFAIAVTFRIKPEHVDAFQTRVLEQARDSVDREPGCHQFDVLVAESDPATFALYETYTDAAAFADHKLTPHFLDFDATVSDWVESKDVRRLMLLGS